MRQFKIHELEVFSEIKAHTIRIWEHRYGVFTPSRSEGNIRYYSLEDVKHLLDIAFLLTQNFRISQLAKMDEALLASTIERHQTEEALLKKAINELIVLTYSAEIEEFEDVLDSCVLLAGIDATLSKVILPYLGRIQLLSYNDTTTETHFVVTAVRKKIILAIESVDPPAMLDKRALLFLPEREHYDLLLLYVAYVLKSEGVRVLYLGTNISEKNLEEVTDLKKPDFYVTYVPERRTGNLATFLHYLSGKLPHTKLYVLTCDLGTVKWVNNVAFVDYTIAQDFFREQLVAAT